eukprot:CAMPEP_0116038052 /NCGR_PEP_ID=MMETSP0321-20121206/22507_1 /TAXON_ID=163516 /ORGANISM="Leptocylindrus danicus var. danicus, Strain B650" /LENGTH=147 /DNA_ID=CAMNT_0003516549 /DNA_START=187 /DNA_END=630 /DNA_ORIENTATION=+
MTLLCCAMLTSNTAAFTLPTVTVTNRQHQTSTASRSQIHMSSSPAVLDRVVIEKKVSDKKKQSTSNNGDASWEVRIYNDGRNTREHVARCLVQITNLSEIGAYQTMMQAHQNGIAVVGRWYYEQAEMYFEQLKSKGIVCDLKPASDK